MICFRDISYFTLSPLNYVNLPPESLLALLLAYVQNAHFFTVGSRRANDGLCPGAAILQGGCAEIQGRR